jgi:hypothetical protein
MSREPYHITAPGVLASCLQNKPRKDNLLSLRGEVLLRIRVYFLNPFRLMASRFTSSSRPMVLHFFQARTNRVN